MPSPQDAADAFSDPCAFCSAELHEKRFGCEVRGRVTDLEQRTAYTEPDLVAFERGADHARTRSRSPFLSRPENQVDGIARLSHIERRVPSVLMRHADGPFDYLGEL